MKKNNTKTISFIIAAIAIVALVFGWFYLTNQPVSLKLNTDKLTYFNVDEPKVEVVIENSDKVESAEFTIQYNNEVLKLKENNNSDGVVFTELKNTITFELTEDFLTSNNNVASELVFESINSGTGEVSFVEDKSAIANAAGEALEVKYENAEFSIGIASRIEQDEKSGETVKENEYGVV